MLQDGAKLGLFSQNQCLAYIGSRFRTVLKGVHSDLSDIEVGSFLIRKHLFVHAP